MKRKVFARASSRAGRWHAVSPAVGRPPYKLPDDDPVGLALQVRAVERGLLMFILPIS